jgi:hypothetical protein
MLSQAPPPRSPTQYPRIPASSGAQDPVHVIELNDLHGHAEQILFLMDQVQQAVPNATSRLIVLLNGDMFPDGARDPDISSNATYISGQTQIHSTKITTQWAKQRIIENAVPTFIRNILEQYRNAHVVFNLGNHEFFMYGANLLPRILGFNTNHEIQYPGGIAPGITMLGEFIQAGRFHIISDANQEPQRPIQFRTSVTVHGIPIVGYSTHNHNNHYVHPELYTLPLTDSAPVSQL